jgi:sepiapterin reductase
MKNIKNLFIITGASTGFGRSLCKQFSQSTMFPLSQTRFVLLSRDMNGMNETRRLMLGEEDNEQYKNHIELISCDLSILDGLTQTMQQQVFPPDSQQQQQQQEYNNVMLIHNAGSLGPLHYVHELTDDLPVVRETVDMNITASFSVFSNFLKYTNQLSYNKRWIINISSLLAVVPFESWSLYCVTKSARKMLCEVIAKENVTDSKLKVLSYQPGPLKGTNMSKTILNDGMSHKANETYYKELEKSDKYVNCDDSASKLVSFLIKDDFESGSSVDYYDI